MENPYSYHNLYIYYYFNIKNKLKKTKKTTLKLLITYMYIIDHCNPPVKITT